MKNIGFKLKAALLMLCWSVFSYPGLLGQEPKPDVNQLIDKIASKIANYSRFDDYQVSVLSTAVRVDKNWKPKKTTVVKKIISIKDKLRREQILSAVETEKGKTKDVTKKYIKQAEKQLRKSEERRKQGKPEDKGRRRELSLEEMLPFGVEARKNYNFVLEEDAEINGIPVL